MSARLVSLTLQNFRGFRAAQTLDLDADIILVRGDNGAGKTSLTDAILWVLMGALPHLTDRVRGLRHTHDPIRNLYGEGPCRVGLTIRTGAGTWLFERTGDAQESTLFVSRDGQPLDGEGWLPRAFGEESVDALRAAVSTWGVLRQDAIRSVLDTGGAALHERMSSVIGLADISRFREACRTTVKELAGERRRAVATNEAAKAASAVARASLDAHRHAEPAARVSLQERLRAAVATTDVTISTSAVDDLAGLAELGQRLNAIIETVTAAADAYDGSVRATAMVPQPSAELQAELAAAESQANEVSGLTADVQQLAQAALQLLSERCPVCDQSIDVDKVRQKLERDLERHGQRLVGASEARSSVMSLRRRLAEVQAAERQRAQAAEELARRVDELSSALADFGDLRVDDSLRRPEGLRAFGRRLDEARKNLGRVYADVRAESEADETRFLAAVQAAAAEEEQTGASLQLVNKHEKSAKELDRATQVAAERIVASWLRALEPSFAEVFDRLSPHPTFSQLRARQDVYYNKNQIIPEVVDERRGVTANPLLVYSEGQLNTVALSYFLGLALNSPSTAIAFMVLDDPLQSMDVLAVLGFADLCRRLRRQRQIVVTTHDRRYADLLTRKLAPREAAQSTIVHEFEDWSTSGPQVSTRRYALEAYPSVLRQAPL